jgi:predicted DCC family thiol-disulfide oxidoreductase YuxK
VTRPRHIVLYDGVCGLCHRVVRFLVAHDSAGTLAFAPLQGETARALRAELPALPAGLATVALVSDGRLYRGTAAFLEAARHLDRPWRWLHALRMLSPLSAPFYWLVARTRYRIFGRFDACRVPSPEEHSRFLP